MRKAFFLLWMMCLGAVPVFACDVCGGAGAAGGSYSGILPQFYNNFIGLRWNGQFMTSQSLPSILDTKGYEARLSYQSFELWGRWYPHPRVQVFGFLPFSSNAIEVKGQRQSYSGLGDASIILQYILINSGDSTERDLKQTWMAGGGVKLPTGAFAAAGQDHDYNIPLSLKPGTGSLGYLLSTNYTLRYNKAGINADATFLLNSNNRDNYRKGNSLSAAMRLFYWYQPGDLAILPQLGIAYEHTAQDVKQGYLQRFTGGEVLYGTAGADVYYKNLFGGIRYQLPVSQDMAEGYITVQQKYLAHVTFMF